MILLTLLLTLFLQTTPAPMSRQVQVTVTDADGRPVADQLIQMAIQRPLVRRECTTDQTGQCAFTFTAGEALLRGRLMLVGRGQRSIIWKGARLEISIQLTESGQVEVATDFTGPPAPPVQTAAAATTTVPTVMANTPTPPQIERTATTSDSITASPTADVDIAEASPTTEGEPDAANPPEPTSETSTSASGRVPIILGSLAAVVIALALTGVVWVARCKGGRP